MYKYNISKENPLKVLSLFSGIGAFEKALSNKNIPFEIKHYCEIDKFASTSYSAIHNIPEELNLGDITKVKGNMIENFDLLVWGSPCTDFSVSGYQEGCSIVCTKCKKKYNMFEIDKNMLDNFNCDCGSNEYYRTKSSLLIEGLRIINAKKPKFIVYENVKQITGNKFRSTFEAYNEELKKIGYNTYFQVLNGKWFNVPQNRERLIMVSIQNSIDLKDFTFPKGRDSGIRLKDILEDTDDFYVSDTIYKRYKPNGKQDINRHEINIIGDTKLRDDSIGQRSIVYGINGIIGTLMATDYKQPKTIYKYISDNKFIRRLTPMEYYLLMGFSKDDYQKSKLALREKFYNGKPRENAQIYKQAGNSIIVPMLEEVFENLFIK